MHRPCIPSGHGASWVTNLLLPAQSLRQRAACGNELHELQQRATGLGSTSCGGFRVCDPSARVLALCSPRPGNRHWGCGSRAADGFCHAHCGRGFTRGRGFSCRPAAGRHSSWHPSHRHSSHRAASHADFTGKSSTPRQAKELAGGNQLLWDRCRTLWMHRRCKADETLLGAAWVSLGRELPDGSAG